jgi:hypothetical protein
MSSKKPKLTPIQKELYNHIVDNWFETGDNARIPTEVTYHLRTARSLENKGLIRLNGGDSKNQTYAEPILTITTTEELRKLVTAEATNLKEHATPDELNRLNINTFNPDSPINDIYGQLTGDTWGERAIELRSLSSKPYSDDLLEYKNPKRDVYIRGGSESPISCYILCENAKNADLIRFLKGQDNELNI